MTEHNEEHKLHLAHTILEAQERTKLARERNLLSAERTFSAWMRTGLAGVGGGFSLLHLISFSTPAQEFTGHWLGRLMIIWGIGVFVLALVDYERACRKMSQILGFSIHPWAIRLIASFLIIMGLCVLILTHI